MCGIAFLRGAVPTLVAAQAIEGAAARGPHSHGWGFPDGEGWTVLRFGGRLRYGTWPRDYVHHNDVRTYIAHSRLATSGSRAGDLPPVNESQPYVEGGIYLVAHNGTIPGQPPGDVDTKAILRALQARQDPVEMLCATGRPQAVIYARERAVFALRAEGEKQAAHPLYAVRGRGWLAVSSGLLTGGKLLPVGKAVALS